jgi:hypothetical protein
MTSYVILHKLDSDDDYGVLAKRYSAASNTAAVRAAAADVQQAGSYVAIPERSFEVVRIEIETNPRVKVVK